MNESPNALQALQEFAAAVSTQISPKMPPETMASIMTANNRLLATILLEHGGRLRLSKEALAESLASKTHVVAAAAEDGSLELTFATKEEIIGSSREVVPL